MVNRRVISYLNQSDGNRGEPLVGAPWPFCCSSTRAPETGAGMAPLTGAAETAVKDFFSGRRGSRVLRPTLARAPLYYAADCPHSLQL